MTNFKAQMTKFQNVLKLGFWILFVIWILSFGFSGASAQQTPEFMVTWKAGNYAPANYQGKVLPTDGTRIEVALEVMEGGRLADLSQSTVNWIANRESQTGGLGLKNFSFVANRFKGNQTVDINIQNYKGATLEKQIIIPIASPEAVITGGPNVFKALLYFFNIKNLSQADLTWSVNGATASGFVERQDILNLDTSNIPSGTSVNLNVSARNILKTLEIAGSSIKFIK